MNQERRVPWFMQDSGPSQESREEEVERTAKGSCMVAIWNAMQLNIFRMLPALATFVFRFHARYYAICSHDTLDWTCRKHGLFFSL